MYHPLKQSINLRFASVYNLIWNNFVSYPCVNVILIKYSLPYDVGSMSEIMLFNKIDKPLVLYIFSGNVMTYITTLYA